jgi:hypothetical protein
MVDFMSTMVVWHTSCSHRFYVHSGLHVVLPVLVVDLCPQWMCGVLSVLMVDLSTQWMCGVLPALMVAHMSTLDCVACFLLS